MPINMIWNPLMPIKVGFFAAGMVEFRIRVLKMQRLRARGVD